MLWVAEPDSARGRSPRPARRHRMVARMKQGVTREQLAAELTRLSKELPARFGGTPGYARIIEQHRAVVDPLLDRMVGPTASTSLWVLLGAVAVVLLIACANVANLFLVRAEGRDARDWRCGARSARARAARASPDGRSVRRRACWPACSRSCSAAVTLPLFLRAAPEGIPRLAGVRLDLPTLAAAFGLVLLAALACGAVPALRASSPDLARLREGGRGSTGRRNVGDATCSSSGRPRSRSCCSSARRCWCRASSELRNVDPGYDTETSTRSSSRRSRPLPRRSELGPAAPRRSWTGCARCPA